MASRIAVSAARGSPASSASAYSRWISADTRDARAEASSSCWAATSHLLGASLTPVERASPDAVLHRPDPLLGHEVQDLAQAADGQDPLHRIGPVDDPEARAVALGAPLVLDEQVQRGAVGERDLAQVEDHVGPAGVPQLVEHGR